MGIFGNREEVLIVDADNVTVDPTIAARLPDAGEFLLRLLSPLDEDLLRAVSMEIDRVRHPNGSIPHANLGGIGFRDWKSGPLTHLVTLTVKDNILVGVWASFGLGRQDRRRLESTAARIVDGQGIPAAATWAINSRPGRQLDVDFLGSQLEESWNEAASQIRNGDVIKSFKKWRR